ncbi:ATP-binding protein [Marinospirillum perlucidum]|uniref:ATP-binding protein n=1 Tax=Marinospirillum perlucidum TaxID=1982602 RepID=UPI000DF26BDE|nr:ATP-binding protein [Marinospirillum perlucidum]
MSHLLRIVLIHSHLDGVVELALDGHTNICGTNASGKTTLQRLVPVFYGELPNRVVPKTRKKFDDFYLPHSNSYLVYEYRREDGDLCQAVLTRKADGGVEYRFIKAGFEPQDYLLETPEGVRARNYSEWASHLRQQKHSVSPKLAATSEYRSVIQNDFSLLRGNSRDTVRLRQLAAQYSLVKQTHRIRHIEKLVSAVHAKEGKLDTLKTMLAAIFEEDGVELPVTGVRNTKARAWIQQMRQSMQLDRLQEDFSRLQQLDQTLAATEADLWQLQPLLEKNTAALQARQADDEASLNELNHSFTQHQQHYEEERNQLNDRLSEIRSERRQLESELEDLQARYDHYVERDIPGLEADLQNLPQWRQDQEELNRHLQLMRSELGDSRQKLEARKLELSQALERQSRDLYDRIQALQTSKEERREEQEEELQRLHKQHEEQLQLSQEAFQEELDQLTQELAEIRAKASVSQLTGSEKEELALAQARIEQAQQDHQARLVTLNNLRQELEASKKQRQTLSDRLTQVRQQLGQADAHLQAIQRQQVPEAGSLRHFLRSHQPGWEQTLGKVLRPELLERSDLAPQQLDQDTRAIYNLQLDLNAIELPDSARDEQTLASALQAAEDQRATLAQEQAELEQQLATCQQTLQQREADLEAGRLQSKKAQAEIDYALEARNRLQEDQRQREKQRSTDLQQQLQACEQQRQSLLERRNATLSEVRHEHQEQLLEYKADWQEELQKLDRQIQQQQHQLQTQRQEQERQLAELEAAFNRELQDKQLDPQEVREAEERLQALDARIRATAKRRDELDDYQRFLRVDWEKRKPQLLQDEVRLKQEEREADQRLQKLKADFKQRRNQHHQDLQALKQQLEEQERQLNQLKPLLSRLESLHPPQQRPNREELPGDVTELIERTHRAFAEKEQLDKQLRKDQEAFEALLIRDASSDFIDYLNQERQKLENDPSGNNPPRQLLPLLAGMLKLLEDQQHQLLEQGRNLGADLSKFFTVFRDLNLRIQEQSRRLSREVADDLVLEGISKSEVKIQSTIDELDFWKPLRHFASLYEQWRQSGNPLPDDAYLDALADVVDLLRSDQSYSFTSLLRLELHLNEGGSDLIIRNDRQLLESSSHGMAYLILCKFLLAFTRLLRGQADIAIHWPIDEIGTLAYHNVEKLFKACESNRIHIVGAFPNPESDVLLLFQHRYLIDRSSEDPNRRQLKRIQPQLSRLAERLQERQEEVES